MNRSGALSFIRNLRKVIILATFTTGNEMSRPRKRKNWMEKYKVATLTRIRPTACASSGIERPFRSLRGRNPPPIQGKDTEAHNVLSRVAKYLCMTLDRTCGIELEQMKSESQMRSETQNIRRRSSWRHIMALSRFMNFRPEEMWNPVTRQTRCVSKAEQLVFCPGVDSQNASPRR